MQAPFFNYIWQPFKIEARAYTGCQSDQCQDIGTLLSIHYQLPFSYRVKSTQSKYKFWQWKQIDQSCQLEREFEEETCLHLHPIN